MFEGSSASKKKNQPASVLPFQVMAVMGGFLYVSPWQMNDQLRFYPTNKPGSDQYFVARSTDEASLSHAPCFASWCFLFKMS